MRDQHLVLISDFKDLAIFRYKITASRGRVADFGAHRRAIKIAEEMKTFNDHLEFAKKIGCPSEVATQLFRRLQTEGEPAIAILKYVYPRPVEDSSCKWRRLPMNWG